MTKYQRYYRKNRKRLVKNARKYHRKHRVRKLRQSRARYAKNKTHYRRKSRNWRKENRERRQLINRRSYKKHADKNRKRERIRHRKWRLAHPRKRLDHRLRWCYGITLKEFSNMKRRQNDVCASCRDPFIRGNRKRGPHVDHCHKTGKVRGILCQRCNLGLGNFLDSPLRLRQALAYLRRAA